MNRIYQLKTPATTILPVAKHGERGTMVFNPGDKIKVIGPPRYSQVQFKMVEREGRGLIEAKNVGRHFERKR